MALIQTFIIGLQMFSDIGIYPSIIQNKRGEEPDFLNTAWTIQIVRGGVLWLADHVLAWHWTLQFLFFVAAGIGWVWPARWLLFWGAGAR